MFLAGLNFGLFYGLIRGNIKGMFTNYEVRWFFFINLIVAVVICILIREKHADWLEATRFALFQTLAVTTTTGFMTEDFDTYPNLARILLFFCMFIGGCAGSTAGGLKVSRVYAAVKLSYRELQMVIRPQAVIAVRLGSRPVSSDILMEILVYFAAFMLLFCVGAIVMVGSGYDILSAMSASIACLSSIGPGLGNFGPIPGKTWDDMVQTVSAFASLRRTRN